MASKKPTKKTTRAAARTTVQKKSTARKAIVKSVARKALVSKGRAGNAAGDAAKRARPKQRIAISHYRDEDFKADGLRAYAQYRDRGVASVRQGLAQAHVTRLSGPW